MQKLTEELDKKQKAKGNNKKGYKFYFRKQNKNIFHFNM